MLSIYHWKTFTSYCFSTKVSERLTQKGWQFTCHLLTDRNVKHLSLENVYLISFLYENNVRLYQKGWQFTCHLKSGKNVKHLSLQNIFLILFKYEKK